MNIEIATKTSTQENLDQLTDLLIHCVDTGASVGWLPPMPRKTAVDYWQSKAEAVAEGSTVLLFAWEDERIVGTVQLALEQRANGIHRAEVQKLLVHTNYRRRGIAQQLMAEIEAHAAQHKRVLLFLDTRRGDASEKLYRKIGYAESGIIPNYVISEDGSLDDTVLYYKMLT